MTDIKRNIMNQLKLPPLKALPDIVTAPLNTAVLNSGSPSSRVPTFLYMCLSCPQENGLFEDTGCLSHFKIPST